MKWSSCIAHVCIYRRDFQNKQSPSNNNKKSPQNRFPKALIAFKDMEVLPFLQRYLKEQHHWKQNLKVFPQIFSEYMTWLFQNQK